MDARLARNELQPHCMAAGDATRAHARIATASIGCVRPAAWVQARERRMPTEDNKALVRRFIDEIFPTAESRESTSC
jgi:hypothetical protein